MMISSPNIVGLRTSIGSVADDVDHVPPRFARDAIVAHAVFDHHDRAIDDHAEVDRAQAQQAGGDAELQHAAEGEQHRQRNRDGNDHRSAQVAEEGEQHGDHEQAAFEQVFLDGVDDVIDQFGAIVDRRDVDVGRQRGFDFVEPRLSWPW